MANFRYLSVKEELAVEELLSQAKDPYVLEQVAAINCAGFTDSVLPTNLENRFRRLKSLPVNQSDPVPSSKKLISHSKRKSRSLNSYVENTRVFHGIECNLSVNSGLEKNSDSLKIGSSSSRLSKEGKILYKTTQTQKLVPEEKYRFNSASSSIDLASKLTELNEKVERSKRKSKSKLSNSWFGKIFPSQAMGCLWSSSDSKKTKNSLWK